MTKTTIYARQVSPEYQESPLFWDFPNDGVNHNDTWLQDITITGNDSYGGMKTELYSTVVSHMNDVEDCLWRLENNKEDSWYKTVTELVEDMFPPEHKKHYSTQEIHIWKELFDEWEDSWRHDRSTNRNRETIICMAMSLISGKEFDYSEIRGCCQGDWQTMFYACSGDKERDREFVERIECEYFNTGTEWIVHDDVDTIPETPEDIEGYSIYVHGYDVDDLKNELMEQGYAFEDCELIAWTHDGYAKTSKYKRVI